MREKHCSNEKNKLKKTDYKRNELSQKGKGRTVWHVCYGATRTFLVEHVEYHRVSIADSFQRSVIKKIWRGRIIMLQQMVHMLQ